MALIGAGGWLLYGATAQVANVFDVEPSALHLLPAFISHAESGWLGTGGCNFLTVRRPMRDFDHQSRPVSI
jgi:hypothetical protein